MKQENHTESEVTRYPEQMVHVITFTLGHDIFGIETDSVHEIIRSGELLQVPNSPDYLKGLINLRGSVFPVINLKKKLKLDDGNNETQKFWIIILTVQKIMTGIMIDRVPKTLKVSPENINRTPALSDSSLKKRYISGVCNNDDEKIIMLDFNQILLVEDMDKLQGIEDVVYA